ncbi:MAG: hypothetical protein KGL13_09830 [Gammaproteobacteria bacterium]|nr:hypothetical protein [Gammaproteobacteria bacterium]MDE2346752.1 hypothetical protein [Gammaproteobacteria bacterium]
MSHRKPRGLILGIFSVGVVLSLIGCSSTKPYTLVAQLPTGAQQTRILSATIDIDGLSCNVRVILLDTTQPWTPICFVRQDHANFKSLLIADQQVDLGAVGDGFQVLNNMLPSLPAPSENVSEAGSQRTNKGNHLPKYPAAGFPTQWNQAAYPGHVVLEGQNTGYLVTKATLKINGSQGTLDVAYKTSYKPLHLDCTVLANQHGDFTLIFNPITLNMVEPGANFNISLVSEGSNISGNIWDASGFDNWLPSLPLHWVAATYSAH